MSGRLDEDGVILAPESRICGVPDHLGNTQCKWQIDVVRWHISGGTPRLSAEQVHAAYQEAWDAWSQVCGFRHEYTPNYRTAHVLATFTNLGGPGGVLAQAELPCGNRGRGNVQLTQQYDGERWVVAQNPPGDAIDFVRVAAHENGHSIGIGHINTGNLLAPTYNPRIRYPQAGDISEARARYGNPSATPTPDPDDHDVPSPPQGDWNEIAAIGWHDGRFSYRIAGGDPVPLL